MTKILARSLIAAALLWAASAPPASAQTSPGWTYGQVPTVAQWNAVFAAKQDYLGAPPLLTTGGTMIGKLVTSASTTARAGLNVPAGAAPTTPVDGDLWTTTSSIFVRINGVTKDLIGAPAASITVGTTTVLSGTDKGLLYNNAGVLGNLASGANGVLVTNGSSVPSISSTLPSGMTAPSLTVTTLFTATGLVKNADLVNASVTVNGTTCTLGSTCSPTAAASSITVGTTTISGGATTRVLYDNAGTLGEYTITGSGTVVAMQTSPSLVTPAIGVATGTSLALGGCTIGANALCATGSAAISSTLTSAAHTVTSAAAAALSVGPNGATNPAFNVDASTASSATGLNVKSAAAAGGLAISVVSSGTNENLTVDAKGSGTITLGGTSTGAITLTRATTLSAALTYGGVTFNNTTTGSGNLVGSASPTFSGTVGGSITLSGNITFSAQGIFTGASAPASAAGNTVVMGTIAAPTLSNNGQAFLYNTTVNGAVIEGAGSTYDVVIANKSGAVAIGVATGTQNPVLPGIAAGTCTNGLAVDASNNVVKIACPGAASSIQVGGTTVSSGTAGKCLVNDNGTLGNVQCALLLPQGRLTLQTGTPVQTAEQTAKSQVFYDCYNGGNLVWVWNGTQDVQLTIGSCEISMTMATSGTGVTNSGGVFDVWAVNVSSTLTLCVATNGSGGGWASDTGGSNTARGTGYSQLDKTTRPYITNTNAITNCYTGATNRGTISANQATYLGTLYTTAAGQTGVALRPTGAAGGANNVVGLSNGYNRVPYAALNRDTTASWSIASTTWRRANNNANNKITFVDGLQTSAVNCRYWASPSPVGVSGTATMGVEMGCQLDWSSGAPDEGVASYINSANTSSVIVAVTPVAVGNYYPQIGVHTIDAVEAGYTATSINIYGSGWGSTAGQMQGLVLESWY